MRITVTKEDLKGALRGSVKHCPLAKAILRRYPKANVSVQASWVYIHNVGTYSHSKRSRQFIFDIDGGNKVELPITVVLKPWQA